MFIVFHAYTIYVLMHVLSVCVFLLFYIVKIIMPLTFQSITILPEPTGSKTPLWERMKLDICGVMDRSDLPWPVWSGKEHFTDCLFHFMPSFARWFGHTRKLFVMFTKKKRFCKGANGPQMGCGLVQVLKTLDARRYPSDIWKLEHSLFQM